MTGFFQFFWRGKKILLRCNLKQSTRSSQRMLTTNKNISSILIIILCLLCQLMIHYPKQLVHYKWFCTVFMGLHTLKSKDGFTFLATVCLSEYQKTELQRVCSILYVSLLVVPLHFHEELLSYRVHHHRNYQIWLIFIFLYKLLIGM